MREAGEYKLSYRLFYAVRSHCLFSYGSGCGGSVLLDGSHIGSSGNLRVVITTAVLDSLCHRGGKAENDKYGSKPPCGLLDKISRLTGSKHLCGSREVGSETATFGVLDQYNQRKQYADYENQDYNKSVHLSLLCYLLFINVSKCSIRGAKLLLFSGFCANKFL